MPRARFPLLLPSLLLVGLLLPASWTAIDQAEATSGGIKPFKGVVMKCVGFNAFSGVLAMVYIHNDGPNPLVAKMRFLDHSGLTVVSVGPFPVSPGSTAENVFAWDRSFKLS